ncbi:MAG TPA: exosome complex protein Rrp42 [Candidatus Bathyarchaeota archaeon]|nr:exosome complex protein Rrp42 [Candidatus Bathyarchaeota archaeon]
MSVTPQRSVISRILMEDIKRLAEQGKRVDGRSFKEYRPINVITDYAKKADGSALVELGTTKVLVGVKIQVGTPFSDTPDKGILTVNAEFLPLASESFEPGPPNEDAISLARYVDRGLRESDALDFSSLVISPGEWVYMVMVDVYVLDHGGNLIDASTLAALSALATTKLPIYELTDNGVEKTDETRPLRLTHRPLSITFAVLGDNLLLDPNINEENAIGTLLSYTIFDNEHICACQKFGPNPLSLDMVLEGFETACEKYKTLLDLLYREAILNGE